jgi:hypothetical protein
MDFIANDGSYAHRGVWHITDNLKRVDIPAKTEDKQYGPGGVIYRHIDDAYSVYTGDAICGQKNQMREGGLSWVSSYRIKPVDGVKNIHRRALRPNVVIGIDGYIPGPLCSRCAKKADIEDRL